MSSVAFFFTLLNSNPCWRFVHSFWNSVDRNTPLSPCTTCVGCVRVQHAFDIVCRSDRRLMSLEFLLEKYLKHYYLQKNFHGECKRSSIRDRHSFDEPLQKHPIHCTEI